MNQDVFNTKVISKSRNYFFNIKQTQRGDYYLVINQSTKSEDGYARQSLMLFDNIIPNFAHAFSQSLQKLAELDPSIDFDVVEEPSESNADNSQADSNDKERKKRYRQLTAEEIAHEQMVNERNGRPRNSGLRWSKEHREQVKKSFLQGDSINTIADTLERSVYSISAELKKQGLLISDENTATNKPF